MERRRSVLRMALLLGCLQLLIFFGAGTTAAGAAAKEGLKKESGKYYFYSKGKKVKNRWETVARKTDDGTVKYRYYFGADGAAVSGKKSAGVTVPKVQKISGKYYGFDSEARMVNGLWVIDGKFYLFRASDGAYQSSASQDLNNAAKEGKKSSTLLGLLKKQVGEPLEREDFADSCYGDGKDSILYYSNFMVQLFTDKKKAETVVCVIATEPRAPAEKETETEKETEKETESGQQPSGDTAPAPGTGSGETVPEGGETAVGEDGGKKPAPAKKRGLIEKNGAYYYYGKDGKKLKSKWKKIGDYYYYFKKDGKAQTYSAKIDGKICVFDRKGRLKKGDSDRIVKIGNRRYYVSPSGRAHTGWQIVKNKLYYADTKTGLIYQSRTYSGIKFSGTGAAENTTAAKLKIKVMGIVSSITNSKMSDGQKLRACWNYVVNRGRFSYGSRYPNLNSAGWQRETALHMLTYHWGNCYSFACAFAALANEVGYHPYVVCGRVSGSRDGAADGLTRHAWVRINGCYYDPEAQFAGWAGGIYGSSYYGVSHQIQRIVDFRS